MSLIPIKFASGHELVDNGCGDYCLKCPKQPEPDRRPWFHMGLVMEMVQHPERFSCVDCGPWGECVDKGPFDLRLREVHRA